MDRASLGLPGTGSMTHIRDARWHRWAVPTCGSTECCSEAGSLPISTKKRARDLRAKSLALSLAFASASSLRALGLVGERAGAEWLEPYEWPRVLPYARSSTSAGPGLVSRFPRRCLNDP